MGGLIGRALKADGDMRNKTTFIYLGLAGIILIIYLVVAWVMLSPQKKSADDTPVSQSTQVSPTPRYRGERAKPPVVYSLKAMKKQEELLNDQYKISEADRAVRTQIIHNAGNKTATLSETATYSLLYVGPLDLFQAEIKTIDISQAKKDAASYFITKGVSKEGICRLPLSFRLSREIVQSVSGKNNFAFDPTPEGC